MKTPPVQRAASRKKLAKAGDALPSGSFPIPDVDYLKRAIKSVGRAPASKRPALAALIRKRAKELNAENAPGVKGTWPFAEAKAMANGAQLALDFALPVSTPAVSSMDGPRVTAMGGSKKAKVPAMHPAAVAVYRKLRAKGLRHGQALAITKRAMAHHGRSVPKASAA